MPHQAGHILSQEEKDQIELDKAIKLGEARLAASELSFSDMARLFSPGGLMNFSDEFFAMVR